MRPDPPRRPDNRCARYPECRNRLPQITARHRRYGGDAVLLDPFCSRPCAERWHQEEQAREAAA